MSYLLTYDHPHRKTQDLLFHLRAHAAPISLAVLPWEERKNHKPLYPVRPEPFPYTPQLLSNAFDVPIVRPENIPPNSLVIVGGAGILPPEFVFKHTVLNAHPGRIPEIRGLDALKWSIYHDEPIGVTVHLIDSQTDLGSIVRFEELPLHSTDTLHSIAIRLYEREVTLLAEAAVQPLIISHEVSRPAWDAHRRMTHAQELVMMKRLEKRLMELR